MKDSKQLSNKEDDDRYTPTGPPTAFVSIFATKVHLIRVGEFCRHFWDPVGTNDTYPYTIRSIIDERVGCPEKIGTAMSVPSSIASLMR